MNIIVCVDDNLGMTFNRRRQSQDRVLRERILSLARGAVLWMNAYSRKQFAADAVPQPRVDEAFLELAGTGEFCFVENLPLLPYEDKIEQLILYRWNRRYPADRRFDIPLEEHGWTLAETAEFAGSSHEKITEERYHR